MSTRFRGLVAAPFTPFKPDRSLNLDAIGPYARLLRDNGVAAAFVCGTTGEGLSLTLEERFRVAERWLEVATLPIIVHVGDNCLANAREFAAHAARIGAAAISTIAPCFFKPRAAAELVDWCEAIASAAPELPFYFYHLPSLTGVNLLVADFLAQAAPRIPSLAGVKFTFEDLDDFSACRAIDGGRFEILFGRDELLLEGLGRGAQGAVGSTYNYAAPLYLRLIAAHRAGAESEARELQKTAVRMIEICNRTGVTHLAATKALMALVGIECGPVRLPLAQPSAAQLARLRAELEAIGFFEFACRPGGAGTTNAIHSPPACGAQLFRAVVTKTD